MYSSMKRLPSKSWYDESESTLIVVGVVELVFIDVIGCWAIVMSSFDEYDNYVILILYDNFLTFGCACMTICSIAQNILISEFHFLSRFFGVGYDYYLVPCVFQFFTPPLVYFRHLFCREILLSRFSVRYFFGRCLFSGMYWLFYSILCANVFSLSMIMLRMCCDAFGGVEC